MKKFWATSLFPDRTSTQQWTRSPWYLSTSPSSSTCHRDISLTCYDRGSSLTYGSIRCFNFPLLPLLFGTGFGFLSALELTGEVAWRSHQVARQLPPNPSFLFLQHTHTHTHTHRGKHNTYDDAVILFIKSLMNSKV